MATFKVLKYHENILLRLGIFQEQKSTNGFFTSPIIHCVLFSSVTFIVSSSMYVYQNSVDFNKTLHVALFTIGMTQSMGMFISFGFNATKIHAVHCELQELVKKSQNKGKMEFLLKVCKFQHSPFNLDDDNESNGHANEAASIYWASELKCRRFVKILLYFAYIQLSTYFGALIPAFLDIFLMDSDDDDGSIDTSSWNLPLMVVLPVDMQTVSGWLLTWLYQLVISVTYSAYVILTTTHFACLCYWIIAICNCFSLLIESITFDTQQIGKQKSKGKQTKHLWPNVKGKLQRAIEMHIKIFE